MASASVFRSRAVEWAVSALPSLVASVADRACRSLRRHRLGHPHLSRHLRASRPTTRRPRPWSCCFVVNFTLVLALGVLIAWRLTRLWTERRSGAAGSRLHVRLVGDVLGHRRGARDPGRDLRRRCRSISASRPGSPSACRPRSTIRSASPTPMSKSTSRSSSGDILRHGVRPRPRRARCCKATRSASSTSSRPKRKIRALPAVYVVDSTGTDACQRQAAHRCPTAGP